MIPLTALLMLTPGVRVDVLGEGRLRFADGRKVVYAASATLAPNGAGLLADAAGHPVLPQIKVASAAFRVAMNGTVTASGQTVGRLVLERAAGDLGFPGEGTFGVLTTKAATSTAAPATPAKTVAEPTRLRIVVRGSEGIEGERVLLRDVAKITGDPAQVAEVGEIDLGGTPSIGVRRSLTVWSIRAALRGTGFAEKDYDLVMPPDATIVRKGQTVEASAIVAAAKRAVASIAGRDDVRYDAGPAPLLAGVGEITLQAEAGISINDKLPVTVTILLDGKEVGRRTLSFLVHLDGVKSGDAVHVTLSRNGAVLETDAKAKTAGHVGETIQIVTNDGATLTATLTGVGTAEVKL